MCKCVVTWLPFSAVFFPVCLILGAESFTLEKDAAVVLIYSERFGESEGAIKAPRASQKNVQDSLN